MTGELVRDDDVEVVRRLEELAGRATRGRDPWPGVDDAVRRSRRARGFASALVLAGALALVVPSLLPRGESLVPAAPATQPAELPQSHGTEDRFGVTFGDVSMFVDFEVQVGSSEPMPEGGGDCAVFDHPLVVGVDVGERGPSLTAFAADGCRGGLVGQPFTAPVETEQPFAGQPTGLSVEPCTLLTSGPVTTDGGLRATRSSFSCIGASLRQWVFDDEVVWMLDGTPRLADLVQSAEPARSD